MKLFILTDSNHPNNLIKSVYVVPDDFNPEDARESYESSRIGNTFRQWLHYHYGNIDIEYDWRDE